MNYETLRNDAATLRAFAEGEHDADTLGTLARALEARIQGLVQRAADRGDDTTPTDIGHYAAAVRDLVAIKEYRRQALVAEGRDGLTPLHR